MAWVVEDGNISKTVEEKAKVSVDGL